MTVAATLHPHPSHQLSELQARQTALSNSFNSKLKQFKNSFHFSPSQTRTKKASGYPKQPLVISPKYQLKFQTTNYVQ